MRRALTAVLVTTLSPACDSGTNEPSATPAPPPAKATASTGEARHVSLRALERLRVGMRPGARAHAPRPSTMAEVDAFLEQEGFSARCGDDRELVWVQDEMGVNDATCTIEDARVGPVSAALVFELRRFELPDEDGVAGLRRVSIQPPFNTSRLALSPRAGPRPEWSAALDPHALAVYGEPARRSAGDTSFAVWRLPDRIVSLVTVRGGTRTSSIIHIGVDDLDLGLFGASDIATSQTSP